MAKVVIERVSPDLYRIYVDGRLVAETNHREVGKVARRAVEFTR
jgi:hypothetical protein